MAKKNDSKSKKKELAKLILGVSLLVVILIVFTIYLAWPLMFGHVVVLETRPVDPFDVFRGQYLTINYEISTIPSFNGANAGDTVYVTLKEDKLGIFRYDNASLSRPGTDNYIKGRIEYNNGDTLRVRYGIEQFFFEKDAVVNTTNMTVEAKISAGKARITRLLTSGKELDIKYSQTSKILS
jgi:uncharacterized membrane-anchored protein